jgi:hypothetical protein
MKLTSIILSFTILLAGCYTPTVVTKDTPQLDNKELIFKLIDGSYVKSKGGQHHRIADGYEVTGNHVYEKYNNNSRDFSGVLRDDRIKEVIISELDMTKTVVAASLGGLLLASMIMLIANPISISLSK